jgi:hypothetical protein
MKQNVATRRRTSRLRTKVSVLIAVITVSALLYWEQTALLYVVSTIAVCVVLSLVALADLESRDKELNRNKGVAGYDANEGPDRI